MITPTTHIQKVHDGVWYIQWHGLQLWIGCKDTCDYWEIVLGRYTTVKIEVLSRERLRSDSLIGEVVLGYGSATDNECLHWTTLMHNTNNTVEQNHQLRNTWLTLVKRRRDKSWIYFTNSGTDLICHNTSYKAVVSLGVGVQQTSHYATNLYPRRRDWESCANDSAKLAQLNFLYSFQWKAWKHVCRCWAAQGDLRPRVKASEWNVYKTKEINPFCLSLVIFVVVRNCKKDNSTKLQSTTKRLGDLETPVFSTTTSSLIA